MDAPVASVLHDGASTEANDKVNGMRKFEFAEFFSGMGGFSRTLEELGGEQVSVSLPLDGYDGWNILEESGYQESERICNETDHAHFAPPCRTYTMARRSDEHGTVRVLRSPANPEGCGDQKQKKLAQS